LVNNIQFIDKSFSIKNIANYHLSLQLTLKGFSFCILDRERNKFIAFGNHLFPKISQFKVLAPEVESILQKDTNLNLPYQHVKLLFATPKFTFIPSSLFDPNTVQQVFGFNHKIGTNEIMLQNFVYGNSSYVVYAIPSGIKSVFEQQYPAIKIYHQSCPLIEEVLLKFKLSESKLQVFVNVYPDFFDFAVLDQGELKLFNSFAYQSVNDFQYFILNSFDQMGLSPSQVPLNISGMIAKDDSKLEQIKKYIKTIEYLNKPAHFDYSYGFQEIPEHYFTHMINLYQCG